MTGTPQNRRKPVVAIALFVALLAVAAWTYAPAGATHLPANKVAVAPSTFEMGIAPLAEGAVSEELTLMSGLLKGSDPTALIITVSAECALWTNIFVVGNDESEAVANVSVWVTLNGVPVPVAGGDDGKVVFCHRAYKMSVMDLDDEDARFEQYLSTRQANSFSWIALNVGTGVQEIEVVAQVQAQVDGMGMAFGAVGKRTLTAEPVMLASDLEL